MLNAIKKFFYRTDWVLLGLCLAASIFGIVMIASASNYHGASTYVSKQIIALVIGLILFVVLSFLDIEILAEHQTLLVILPLRRRRRHRQPELDVHSRHALYDPACRIL